MLTPSGWLTLAASVIALVIGRVLVLAEMVMLAAVGVLLVAVCLLAVWVFCPKTRLRRRHSSSVVSVGESTEVSIQFEKRLWPPMKLPMHVQDAFKHYKPGIEADQQKRSSKKKNGGKEQNHGEQRQYERFTVSFNISGGTESVVYSFNPARRGIVRFGPLRVRSSDPFGIARRKWKETAATEVLALPPIEDVIPPPLSLIARSKEEEACSIWRGSPSGDFLNLREYVHGDDLRQVHWKSTARTGNLMIRQSEHRRESGALLLLDTRTGAASEQDFEKMVGAAASLCVACRNHKMPLDVAIFQPHLEFWQVIDESSLGAALRMLALVFQSEESQFPEARSLRNLHQHGAVVVLTGSFAYSAGEAAEGLHVCFGDQPSAASEMWVPPEAKFSDVWNSFFWETPPRMTPDSYQTATRRSS